jgi:phosphosulfolactate synthase
MNFNLKNIPERNNKPREKGITMVIDKGSSIQQCKDLIESSSQYFDVIKFGWTTSNFMNSLKKKIKLFKDAGIDVYFGGTLFEAFAIRDQFEDYISILKDYNLSLAEVSDGSISIPHKKKC